MSRRKKHTDQEGAAAASTVNPRAPEKPGSSPVPLVIFAFALPLVLLIVGMYFMS